MRRVPHTLIHLALITGLGSGLEYYAFITFAMQASVLSQLFFHSSHAMALVETFFVFALGSIAMPLGGFIFGTIGDHVGRKKMLMASITVMTFATVMIGLLPTHLPFYLSIIFLMIFRVMQGLAEGGELPGAITFIYEHALPCNRGFLSGLLFLGVSLGAGLSTFVNLEVSHFFTTEQVLAFAWRLPFLLAIFLGLAGLWLRCKTTESALFLDYLSLLPSAGESGAAAQMRGRNRASIKKLLLGIAVMWFPAVLVSMGLFLPGYLTLASNHSSSQIFSAMLLGFLGTAIFLPIFGWIGDHIGQKKLYAIALVVTFFTLPILIWFLQLNVKGGLYFFNFGYYFLIVMMAACYPMILPSLFPIDLRYRLMGLSYAGCYSIAGTLPLFASIWILHMKAPLTVLILLGLSGLTSFFFLWRARSC